MKDVSRTGHAARNVAGGVIYKFGVALLKLFGRIWFVKILGEVMLGISGLFTNVLGALSLAEMGIGTAISFSLYRPIAEHNEEKILALMGFFRKAYRIIALTVAGAGILIMPLLPKLIRNYQGIEYFYFIYLVFLLNMVIDYLFSYKRTLAVASQEEYTLVPFTMGFETLICLLQIAVLFLFRGVKTCYLIYLFTQSVCLLAENIVINRYLGKRYPALNRLKGAPKLPEKELREIKINVKALIYHKIGSFAVTSTDNLLISGLIDLVIVGHYGNYSTILATVAGIVYLFVGNLTASFGNLIAKEDAGRRHEVFREMLFFYYFLYGVASALLLNLFEPFILFSYGENYLLHTGVVILVVGANFYLLGIANVLDVVKSAAGLYDLDKWVPLVQAAVNLILSIVLGKTIGLAGIFVGTLVSTLVPLTVKPFIVYRNVFNSSPLPFFTELVRETLLCAFYTAVTFFLCRLLRPLPPLVRFVGGGVLTGAVSVLLFFLFHLRDGRIKRLWERLKSLIPGRKAAK